MKFFLFAGGIRRFVKTQHSLQAADFCSRMIVGAEDRETGEKLFSEWLFSDDSEDIVAQRMDKIVGAPMLDELLTESGQRTIDWGTIDDEVESSRQAAMEGDDFEQGFWADVNQIVPTHFNVDSLLQNLPEDIRSGLNWSATRKFYFLLSALGQTEISETTPMIEDAAQMVEEDPDFDLTQLKDGPLEFPELVSRELSVLIEARNAVVAACLWRKHPMATALAANAIRIDSWCGVITR